MIKNFYNNCVTYYRWGELYSITSNIETGVSQGGPIFHGINSETKFSRFKLLILISFCISHILKIQAGADANVKSPYMLTPPLYIM